MVFPRFSCVPFSRSGSGRQLGSQRPLLLAFALVFVFSGFAPAQDSPSTTNQKFTVSGTVVNDATGEPITRAMVTLQASPARYAFTDSNGAFSMEAVAPGRYPIQAQKPGFFGPQERSSYRGNQSVEVGANSDPVVIKLAAENVIFGRLTDGNGQPVDGVGLRLTQRMLRNGIWRMEPRSSATSDEDGVFRFPNLQAGTYYLSAGPDVARRETLFGDEGTPRTGWPGMYYPQAPDLASAAPIHLISGQKIEASMVMNRVPLHAVSGQVSGYFPGRGVSIQVQTSSGEFVATGVRFHEATGEFETLLPAGSYRLRAFSQVGEQQLRCDVRITVEKDLNQLQLALQPAVSIPIHARMEDRGQDAAQSAQSRGFIPSRDANDSPPLGVHLIASDPGGHDVYSINGGAQGNHTLSLRSIEPGRYTAEFSPYGGWYVASAQCGNANLLTEDLVITAGSSCTLEIELRNDGGNLTATVEGGKPGSPGVTLLAPARGRAAPRMQPFYTPDPARPAQIGLNGIAPGDYLLFAFDSAEGVEYSNPEVLRSYASQAAPVSISPGQSTKVTTHVIQTGAATE